MEYRVLPALEIVHPPDERPRFLSEAACHDIAARLAQVTRGGGVTSVSIHSRWTGNVRWARNRITTSGEARDNDIRIVRSIRGATSDIIVINETTTEALAAAARRAERMVALTPENVNGDSFATHATLEPILNPSLFSEATYNLTAQQRTDAAVHLMQSAKDAGMLSAGYLEVSAHGIAMLDTLGHTRYFRYTAAEYSVTVRDPKGVGSGWAGVDWYDWSRIDAPKLSTVALEKCLNSRNPVAVEPGRYTVILEPQAVSTLTDAIVSWFAFEGQPLDRFSQETNVVGLETFQIQQPFPGYAKLGKQIIDERLTLSVDPMDPELGFPPFLARPFDPDEERKWTTAFRSATWIKNGILTELSYDRRYAVWKLAREAGLPNSGAYRMSGGTTSIDDMIATTKRGLVVTRFDQVMSLAKQSLLIRGYTRDGLWLVENGKITKPVKNLVFTESPLFALNKVEQLGVPQRVYHGGMKQPTPVIVPPLKISDFSFTALSDAV